MHERGPASDGNDTLLEVTLKRDTEQIADVVRILRELEVPVADCMPGSGRNDAGTLLVRIPPDRAFEAVLALNCHGFPDVRVYGPR